MRTAFGLSPKNATYELTDETVLDALRKIRLPNSDQNIVAAHMVSGLTLRDQKGRGNRITGKQVAFAIEVDPESGATFEPLRLAAEAAIAQLPTVTRVSAVLTSHKIISPRRTRKKTVPHVAETEISDLAAYAVAAGGAKKKRGRPKKIVTPVDVAPEPVAPAPDFEPENIVEMRKAPPQQPPAHVEARLYGPRLVEVPRESPPQMGTGVPMFRPPRERVKLELPGIRRIVAVASGKGGVGKSTTAVNLAIACQQNGLRVGLLDADIYGPSIPRMLGLSGKPRTTDGKKMIPHHWNGMAVMSIGFLVEEESPIVWRGPMVHGAITQLFRDVAWGSLDILIVDMPPGTGDAQLTMAQQVPMSGAVIVSTPQDIALIDARKGLAMFERVDVPVLGIIENMSYFLCPHCNGRSDIFSHGGARHEAERMNVPFFGEVPLDITLRQHSDDGTPLAFADRNGAIAKIYRGIARDIWRDIGISLTVVG